MLFRSVLSLSLNKMPDDFYRIQKDVELNENQSFGGAVSMKSSSGSVIAIQTYQSYLSGI